MIPYPTGITLTRWADELKLAQPDWDIQPQIIDESKWKEWGNQLIQSTVLQSASAPRTDQYGSWQQWAEALIKSIGIY